MMVIGLTGGIASGKSTVAAMLRNANIPVIDADILARNVTTKGSVALAKIIAIFGETILAQDGSLDRQKLGKIVFADQRLLRRLESIIHPAILELSKQELKALEIKGHAIVVYMAPLIFEQNLQSFLTKTILIIADKDIAKMRAVKRDTLSLEEIEQRMNAQLSDSEKSIKADYIIENNGTINELYKKLMIVWTKITGQQLPEKYSD